MKLTNTTKDHTLSDREKETILPLILVKENVGHQSFQREKEQRDVRKLRDLKEMRGEIKGCLAYLGFNSSMKIFISDLTHHQIIDILTN